MEFSRQNDWRAELFVGTKSYGRFNHSELTFGSESSSVPSRSKPSPKCTLMSPS